LHDAIPVLSIHAVVQVPRGQEEGRLLVNVNRRNLLGNICYHDHNYHSHTIITTHE
jgi:hypothetical protein